MTEAEFVLDTPGLRSFVGHVRMSIDEATSAETSLSIHLLTNDRSVYINVACEEDE